MKITNITASVIQDSSGQPALEVELELDNSKKTKASVPSGISVGSFEKKPVSCDRALAQIENAASELRLTLIKTEISSQNELDIILSGLTLGANVSLAISIAFCRATDWLKTLNFERKKPRLLMLCVEGGKHAENNLSLQEFLVDVENFNEGREIYWKLRDVFEEKKIEYSYGQEGGYSPKNLNNEDVLKLIQNVGAVRIGLDMAVNSVKQDINIKKLVEKFPIFSLEDPYSEDEWEKWSVLTGEFGQKILIVGDDLTVTNPQRVKKAIELAACGGIVVKPNQIGTVSETIEVVKLAKMANLKIIVSHRARETNDTFIADLAYYTGADYVKFGAPRQEERLAKYQRLEELLG